MKMKKRLCQRAGVIALTTIFSLSLLSGCSFDITTNFGGATAKQEESGGIPTGSYPTIMSRTINVGEKYSVTLPEGFHYAEKDTESEAGTVKAFYCYDTEVNYISPTDSSIMFYAYAGNDLKTPDKELTSMEATTSMKSYLQNLTNDGSNRTNVMLGNVNDLNSDDYKSYDYWVYAFSGYENRDTIVSTYNATLYPKYFYGIILLEKDVDEVPSRNWYMFVFSNNDDTIFDEADYTRIFTEDLLEQFGIAGNHPTLFTEAQAAQRAEAGVETDPDDVTPNGYSYEQLLNLFADTMNYYQIKPNISTETESTSGEEEAPVPTGDNRKYTGLYAVTDVLDGNSIKVDLDSKEVIVNLVGLDVPDGNTAEGKESTSYVEEVLAQYGNYVYLEWGEGDDENSKERFAYAYVTDGSMVSMLNPMVIEAGLARAAVGTEDNEIRYAADFERVESAAKKGNAGHWGTEFYSND